MNRMSRIIYGAAEGALRRMRGYHRHEVHGLEHVPRSGPALLVFHHSLATYDSFLLGPVIKDHLGRQMRGVADRQIFRTPVLGRLFTDMGFVNGTREGVLQMLARGDLIGLAPGGMRESLRSSRRKYQVDWARRRGFVWLAVHARCPIVLAACPRADDIFHVYDNPLTPLAYAHARVPLPLFRGRGLSPLPRPVTLHHLLSEPLYPELDPAGSSLEDTEAYIDEFHERVTERMRQLLRDALALSTLPRRAPAVGGAREAVDAAA
ncbi:lysophospholipid acyltransferase family protein [Haliangium sp.]|uniref:lysophospholipid acyltransferase family protein n=1 Tax=Haliangium sp. TaxID=2663208 RepID=UPI003D12DB57